jgi:5'(3')-deoxyribonucleotidase
MRILLVDVDLVVAPSDVHWREHLGQKHGYVKCAMTNYNFGSYYPQVENAYSFWKDLDYFDMKPIEDSVEKLEALSKYFQIVFLSAEKCGYNSKNKKSWLKEHYPFLTGYVSTEEKWLLDNDNVVGLIDDRLDNLKGFDYHKRIVYKTRYEQKIECPVVWTIEDWNSLNIDEFHLEFMY